MQMLLARGPSLRTVLGATHLCPFLSSTCHTPHAAELLLSVAGTTLPPHVMALHSLGSPRPALQHLGRGSSPSGGTPRLPGLPPLSLPCPAHPSPGGACPPAPPHAVLADPPAPICEASAFLSRLSPRPRLTLQPPTPPSLPAAGLPLQGGAWPHPPRRGHPERAAQSPFQLSPLAWHPRGAALHEPPWEPPTPAASQPHRHPPAPSVLLPRPCGFHRCFHARVRVSGPPLPGPIS